MKRLNFAIVMLMLCCPIVKAQKTTKPATVPNKPIKTAPVEKNSPGKTPLFITARHTGDSVILRWAPGLNSAWRNAIKEGYILEKAIIQKGVPRYSRLAEKKAVGKEELVNRYQTSKERNVALALATLYNETAAPISELSFDKMIERSNAFNLVYGYNLLMADIEPEVADLSGLRIVDTKVPAGAMLGYRVFYKNLREGISDTAYVLVDTRYQDTLPAVPTLKASGLQDKVALEWQFQPEQFVAWYIEKARPGSNQFFRLHQLPYTFTEEQYRGPGQKSSFTDTGLKAYEPWEYRLVGITSFGEKVEGQSTIIAMAKDVTPPPTPEMDTAYTINHGVQLKWSIQGKLTDLKGFVVMKSTQAADGFLPISATLSTNERSWIDTVPALTDGNYYQIMAYDTAGNSVSSPSVLVFSKDTVAPAVPEWVEGVADTNGIVKLKWKASLAPDLQGYRLYRAYSSTHAFSLVTPRSTTDTFYQDTLMRRSLTSKVFYKLTVEDLSDNVSDLGTALFVKRPDLVAPEAPVLLRLITEGEKVVLSILPSQSEDVQKLRIERRTNGSDSWTAMEDLSKQGNEQIVWVDTNFSSNAFLEYRLQAIDSSGNLSDYSRTSAIKAPMRQQDYWGYFRANWVPTDQKVKVEWQCSRKEANGFVSLIRQIGEQTPRTIQSFKEEIIQFEDATPAKGQQVRYWLRYAGENSEFFTTPIELIIP